MRLKDFRLYRTGKDLPLSSVYSVGAIVAEIENVSSFKEHNGYGVRIEDCKDKGTDSIGFSGSGLFTFLSEVCL